MIAKPNSNETVQLPGFLHLRDDYFVLTLGADSDLYPFQPGWQLFFLEARPEDCIGDLCLVLTEKGEMWVKRLAVGAPGLFNLEHFTPIQPTISNVEIVECYRMQAAARPDA